MIYFVSVLLLFTQCLSQEEEVFQLPTLKGNAFFADPFANTDGIGQAWKLTEASKGDGNKFDGGWAIESSSAGGPDLGLVVKDKAKHHAISAKLAKPVDFKELHADNKPLVIQYEVKYQDSMDCGGSYLKLVAGGDEEFSSDSFNDRTTYSIMFGPDKCGLESRIHFIINYKNPVSGSIEEKHAKASSNFKDMFSDGKSHLVSLTLEHDGTFDISVDQVSVNSGSILTDMTPAINPEQEINDPEDFKPSDWDDQEKIPDPMAVKPEEWDEDAPKTIADLSAEMPSDWLPEEPEYTADPEAVKPEEWDEEEDGEWEAPQIANPKCEAGNCGQWTHPQIPNPEFKGKWAAPMIDNPNYSGVWAPKKIANPFFFEDKTPFASLYPISAIGIEMWTMTKDIMFDNVLITDSKRVAEEWAADSWAKKALQEKMGEGMSGYIDQFFEFSAQYPFMWIVYIFVVALPIVLVFYFCTGKSEADLVDEAAEAKKTDAVQADDEEEEVPDLEEEEEKEVPDLDEGEAEGEAEEEAEEAAEAAEEVVEEAEEEEEAPAKRRTRKAD